MRNILKKLFVDKFNIGRLKGGILYRRGVSEKRREWSLSRAPPFPSLTLALFTMFAFCFHFVASQRNNSTYHTDIYIDIYSCTCGCVPAMNFIFRLKINARIHWQAPRILFIWLGNCIKHTTRWTCQRCQSARDATYRYTIRYIVYTYLDISRHLHWQWLFNGNDGSRQAPALN